jgi:hypothetical protein
MSRSRQAFKQGDVTKAIKAAIKAGARVARVEIIDGKIVVHLADEGQTTTKPNEWE